MSSGCAGFPGEQGSREKVAAGVADLPDREWACGLGGG